MILRKRKNPLTDIAGQLSIKDGLASGGVVKQSLEGERLAHDPRTRHRDRGPLHESAGGGEGGEAHGCDGDTHGYFRSVKFFFPVL